ncbi:MAG: hypothetical protein EP332_03955 [Bacteroidetes bacterium]|nr:MAG: hypothetical protein EP332_03955 [Bacteroidota bacterium]
MNKALSQILEHSEALYWSRVYGEVPGLPTYTRNIQGAIACSIPQIDMLALNRVIGLGFEEAVKPETLEEIKNFFRQAGAPRFFIQLSPHVPQEGLSEMMTEHGFKLHNRWAKLWQELEKEPLEPNTELSLVEIGKADAKTYAEIIKKSFGWEQEGLLPLLSESVGKKGYTHYLAYHGETAIAAAALHLYPDAAAMAFAGTLPEYRGLGAQNALLQIRLKKAWDNGVRLIHSETAENTLDNPVASYRNMVRNGFQEAYTRDNWICVLA